MGENDDLVLVLSELNCSDDEEDLQDLQTWRDMILGETGDGEAY